MNKESTLIDTDIIYKLGNFSSQDLLRKVLLSLGYNLFIHEYLISEELILKDNAKKQLDEMLTKNEISIIKVTDLNDTENKDYVTTLELLAKEMDVDLEKKRDRNAGEVKSMAMAFAKCYKYFISDDRGARVSANKHLQNIDGTTLNTINMKDIIIHIKDNSVELSISRKMAKQLYLYCVNPKITEDKSLKTRLEEIHSRMKMDFDENIWPID